MLAFGYIIPLLNSQASQSWQEVPCKILSSKVEKHKGEDSTTYSVGIKYEYEFKNQKFQSTRYDFNFSNSRSRQKCQKIVQGYLEQPDETCFVDPDNPQSSVIERDVDVQITFLIIGIIFPFAGIAFAFAPFLFGKRKRSITGGLQPSTSVASSNLGAAQNVSLENHPADLGDQSVDSPQRLKPASTRIGNLIGGIFISLFWNGIVGLLLWQAFTPQGGFAIFMFLFLIPFMLIGAVILLGTISSFLSLFSPTVEIATSTGAVPRGQAVDVAWEIKGSPRSIKRLRIAAVATEEARYQQGTDTHTAKSDFFSKMVADTTDQKYIAFGSTSVTIPADTMHTFGDKNNKIVWALHVKAEIGWWPDVKDKYKFRVKP